MSVISAMTVEMGATEREVAAQHALEALWGIGPGQSSPKKWTTTAAYTVEDSVAEWLYRIWGCR